MTHKHAMTTPKQGTFGGMFSVDPGIGAALTASPVTLARTSDPDTSHQAAMTITPESARARVLAMFQHRYPDTWVDIYGNPDYARQYGGSEGTFRKRRSDLVNMGLVQDSGIRAKVAGHSHVRWALTPAGIAWEVK